MQPTNKNAMEMYYKRVLNYLKFADESLREAEDILKSDFIIDNNSHCADDIDYARDRIYSYETEIVSDRILPAIRNL